MTKIDERIEINETLNKHQTATDVYTMLPTGTGNLLELFAGSRSVGKVGERLGYNVFSIDWGEYDGIDLTIDYSTCCAYVLCLIIKLKLYVKRKMLGFCR